jgi:hypothetical protein
MRYKSISELPLALRAQVQHIETPTTAGSAPRKYRNEPAYRDGKRFDSKLEADFYDLFTNAWHAGQLRWFVRQVTFELQGGVKYRADFVVFWRVVDQATKVDHGHSRIEVVDCKGLLTQESINKLKQVQEAYGVTVSLGVREGGRLHMRPWR